MLVIRSRQYKIFQDDVEMRFAREIAADLEENCPEYVSGIDPDHLVRRVAAGILRARRYGFKRKYSIGMFVELMFLAAPNFDAYPPAQSILTRGDIATEERIDRLIAAMDDRHWENIRRRSDPAAWGENFRP